MKIFSRNTTAVTIINGETQSLDAGPIPDDAQLVASRAMNERSLRLTLDTKGRVQVQNMNNVVTKIEPNTALGRLFKLSPHKTVAEGTLTLADTG